ncbi:MAG: hypothetical protein M3R36_15540 [Bacteroidota bacterium]|nr:hypothetical protein [Bacteroidota bacterium]
MEKIILLIVVIAITGNLYSQNIQNDSVKIDYKKIYSFCLDGDVKTALAVLESVDFNNLTEKDLEFKTQFESRFKNEYDESDFLESRKSQITELLEIYHNYWRVSLLDNLKNYDSLLIQNVVNFLTDNYALARKLIANEDSLNVYFKKYIESFGLHTTGFGKTGKYFDLLVWASEKDTTYTFLLHDEKTNADVVFMDNFITLGWEEYATLDRYYPGGWATKKALYCVKKAYDLNSEEFMISYLAHESRHFADYKIFPKLMSADLEFRAKLTELSMAQNTLYKTIEFFINNSNYESENGHSVANYCVIRDLSKGIFKIEFEKDINKWKERSIEQINNAAYDLLKANTKSLTRLGTDVEKYIKK